MSDLEEYIRKNQSQFDLDSPPDGHLERFKLRLENKRSEHKSAVIWRIAAGISVLVVVAFSMLLPRSNSPQDVHYGSMALSDVSKELAQVEFYYESRLKKEYDEIDGLSESDPLVASYLAEIEFLKTEYKELESILYDSGSHEKVILAMIENFRIRLDLMEKLEAHKNQSIKTPSK